MKKKGVVFIAVGLGLVLMWQFGPISAWPIPPTPAGQSVEVNSLVERQFAEAVLLLKRENFSDAIAAYEKVIQLMPESPIAQDARYWIGQTYFRMGKYDEALSVFKKLLKDYPGSPIVPVTQLMVSRAEQEKEAKKTELNREAALDKSVIVDPKTAVEFKRIHVLTGKSDIIEGVVDSLSPNGKFLLNAMTIIPLDGTEPFALDTKQGLRGTWSPDGKMAAYYAENAIWLVPVSPESGRPSGPVKKLLDGKYKYQYPVSWSPDSAKMAIHGTDDKTGGDLWIFSIKDGTLTQLTADPGFESNACWSPDGKTLAYMTREATQEIRLVSAGGGESEKIIGMEYGRLHSWSPNGTWLAYDDRLSLHLYRLADKRVLAIDSPDDVGRFFSWSRDGEKMLFYRPSYDWRSTLRIASIFGGPSFQLARNSELWPYRQFWAADSNKITTLRAGDSQFVMISLSGGEPIPLELNVAFKEKPKPLLLSPDQKYLLFSVDLENGNENLYTVPVSLEKPGTTGPPVMVFRDWDRRQVLSQSSWSPDGKKIALIHKGNLWVTSSKEIKPVQLTMTSTTGGDPLWSPRGDKIGFVAAIKEDDRKLMVIPASGGEPATPLSQIKTFQTWCWAPDGKSLTVISDKKMSNILLDGGKAREILDLEGKGFTGRFWELTWLPDGKRVAFLGEQVKSKGNSTQIYLASPETGEITELAADDKSWKDGFFLSPDGKWISYYTDEFIKTRPSGTIWEVKVEDLIKGKK
jgi:Tol biopolymer transport system component